MMTALRSYVEACIKLNLVPVKLDEMQVQLCCSTHLAGAMSCQAQSRGLCMHACMGWRCDRRDHWVAANTARHSHCLALPDRGHARCRVWW